MKSENELKTLLLIFNESDFLEDRNIENLFAHFPAIQNEGIENLIVYIDFLDAIDKKELLIRILSDKIWSVSQKNASSSSPKISDCFIISDFDCLPDFSKISDSNFSDSSDFSGSSDLFVYFVFNLGGREELKKILSAFIQKCQNKQLSASDMTPEFISSSLPLPFEPDFIISVSKNTLTDFMIWQTVYSEYYYLDKDIGRLTDSDFRNAFENFKNRGRRYGV